MYGAKSIRIKVDGIKFDSKLEFQVYEILKKYYSSFYIHIPKILSEKPQLKTILDFETPDFYIEVKGNWCCKNEAIYQTTKIKYYWFINKFSDKPLIMVTNGKFRPFKGIQTLNINTFECFLKRHALYTR